jgi:trans-aconitate methyltransferase
MTDTLFASWLLPEVAAEHDDMNREYFEKGTVGNYPYFSKLRDAMSHITQAERGMMSCLDVGCGAGWQAKYLDMVGFSPILRYEGLDISPHMCERAQRNYPDGVFRVADILEFSPGKTWDIVMACGSIEHFSDWKFFLAKLAELSSKWVVVHKVFFTDRNAPTWIFERTMYQGLKEIRVVMNFEEFSTVLDSLGFEVVHKYGWDAVSGVIARKKAQ